ncbi:MAG TPA: hypothetical protein VLA82_02775 [Actinomycetota bacterium]|nr:hypothetical protein [Actinomycetota bacterium]
MDRFSLATFFHVASVVSFVAFHSVSMVVMFRIRKERDRTRVLELVSLSGQTTLPMYISLGAILVSGSIAAFVFPGSWGRAWLWIAIVILLLTVALMTAVAKPYFERVKTACAMRPSGVPRVSDEELGEILGGRTPTLIATIGIGGFTLILFLMIAKPFV